MRRVTLGRLAAGLLAIGLVFVLAGAVLAATGSTGQPLGSGTTGAAGGSPSGTPAGTPAPGSGWGSFGSMGGMMGGGYGMMGGASGNGMGQVMGSVLAGRVGQPITQAQATSLGAATPSGATVDRTANRITFQTQNVRLAVLASPPDADMKFRIGGLVNPTIVVPQGATVTVQLINADSDSAHNWAVTSARPPFPYMSMMSGVAFAGAWATPLGDPTSAGLPSETISFTASTAGTYTYLCQVPGHAAQGMYGTFQVAGS